MTVNELIKELQEMAENGCGEWRIRDAEGDDVYSIIDDDRINEVIMYFQN